MENKSFFWNFQNVTRSNVPSFRILRSFNSTNRYQSRGSWTHSTLRIPGTWHNGRVEGVTSNGSTYPNWTGPRADWRAILSSLINARVMDSVGFKPACSCWRHNRQDTITLATLDTITMLQLATLSFFRFPRSFDVSSFLNELEVSLDDTVKSGNYLAKCRQCWQIDLIKFAANIANTLLIESGQLPSDCDVSISCTPMLIVRCWWQREKWW